MCFRDEPAGRLLPAALVLCSTLLSPAESSDPAEPPSAERPPASQLEARLRKEDPQQLAAAARAKGDPVRGALVFHRPELNCVTCHAPADADSAWGPDLAGPAMRQHDDVHLVESVLAPSKAIADGYQGQSIVTLSGRIHTGIVVDESSESVVLRDADRGFQAVTIPKEEIDERTRLSQSAMPEGLVNQVGSRDQFLDLVRYLMEIAEGGPTRASQLQPTTLGGVASLPEYEQEIDHAGLIHDWDDASYERGRSIYHSRCASCHGTAEGPGSLPTSLRFTADEFKNGCDPYSIYQTLTHGFGMMVPQRWMVPQQKYDVIHYIREAYLRERNPDQYSRVNDAYIRQLPPGTERGPEPGELQPWAQMDYGPYLMATYDLSDDDSNFAFKGIAIRLDDGPGGVAAGRHFIVYDHDTLRVAGAFSGEGFIDYNGINFNGQHDVHPQVVGEVHFSNPEQPGWANPVDGGFADPRLRGRDGRAYGPLPDDWARYRGLYRYGNRQILAYRVGDTQVLEMPSLAATSPATVVARTLNLSPRQRDLTVQVAQHGPSPVTLETSTAPDGTGTVAIAGTASAAGGAEPGTRRTVVGLAPAIEGAEWIGDQSGAVRLRIPAGSEPLRFTLWTASVDDHESAGELVEAVELTGTAIDLSALTTGGPPLWPDELTTQARRSEEAHAPLAVDVLSHPVDNPWSCRLRMTGVDFLSHGSQAVVSTWDGSVWHARGLDDAQGTLTWRRIASGLFQPLGIKVVDNQVYVGCRDQIVRLHDFNNDGETDFYENFNSDHQVTEHFHEFAMDLQVDEDGNFYYAKGARHAKDALVPHHGTLLKVRSDGSQTKILANGFRAPNGVCLNPDGTFFMTDQEGHWVPKNRINWVRRGRFYGNMLGYHDVTDSSDQRMEPPICWITNRFDRSPSELVWVPENCWGPLAGGLLNLSYGYGKVYLVLREMVDDQLQGGMVELPIPAMPTGVMRGRFSPADDQLYCCGMFAWASNQQMQEGGLFRIRYTGQPLAVPVGLATSQQDLILTFAEPLDKSSASDAANYTVKVWDLKRSANYGSEHVDERPVTVQDVQMTSDEQTVKLRVDRVEPTRGMEIGYRVRSASGEPIQGTIHNTIHQPGNGQPNP